MLFMVYTNAVVTDILLKKFREIIKQRIDSDVSRLETDDVPGSYNGGVEQFALESLDNLTADNIETESDEDTLQVEGEMYLDTTLVGLKEFNGEMVIAGNYSLHMVYHFTFEKTGNKYENLTLEYLE